MNMPDEKVEQLAEAIWRSDKWEGDPEDWADLHVTVRAECMRQADALAPLLAGWLADAYERGVNDTFATDGALLRARAEGEARVRARVEALTRWAVPTGYVTGLRTEDTRRLGLPTEEPVVRWSDLRAALYADAEESQ